MSIYYEKYVNNVVDNKEGLFYNINKRKRRYWNSRSQSVSCRVREKCDNRSKEFSSNIRAYLLDLDKDFLRELDKTMNIINKEDQKIIESYVYSLFSGTEKESIKEKMVLIVRTLDKSEIFNALCLGNVVSCRLLGYEAEAIYLFSYCSGHYPAYILRCLYHTIYEHKIDKVYNPHIPINITEIFAQIGSFSR